MFFQSAIYNQINPIAGCFPTNDMKECTTAFLEKRKPDFFRKIVKAATIHPCKSSFHLVICRDNYIFADA